MMVNQEQMGAALLDAHYPGTAMDRDYVCLEDYWPGQEIRETSQSLDEAWIRAQGGLRLQRAMRTTEEICGRSWPLDLAIAKALDEHGPEDVGGLWTDRRVWRKMTMWAEEKVWGLRRARVQWIDMNSEVGIQVYTRAGTKASMRDGWSWHWQGERQTVEGRPVSLREARSAPLVELRRGVGNSPGPWARGQDQTESDWWSAWRLVIIKVLEGCMEMGEKEGKSFVRATLSVPELLAVTRMMVETRSVRLEGILAERDMELVTGYGISGAEKRRKRGMGIAGWRANAQLEDDVEEAEGLQVMKWRQARAKGKVVVKMAGPEDECKENE